MRTERRSKCRNGDRRPFGFLSFWPESVRFRGLGRSPIYRLSTFPAFPFLCLNSYSLRPKSVCRSRSRLDPLVLFGPLLAQNPRLTIHLGTPVSSPVVLSLNATGKRPRNPNLREQFPRNHLQSCCQHGQFDSAYPPHSALPSSALGTFDVWNHLNACY